MKEAVRTVLRALWLGGGFLSLGIGIVGIVLPLLPTVPFLLLSAFCFERGSERFHDWLVHHDRFGQPIREWREHGAISKRSKIMASCTMAALLGLSIAMGVAPFIVMIQGGVLSLVALFVLSRPLPPVD